MKIFTASIIFLLLVNINSSAQDSTLIKEHYKHSINFSPMSPLFRIYAIQYGYHFSENDAFTIAPSYQNIHYDFGNTNAFALIVGYRRYLWKELHLEYQLYPTFDNFYEKNENKYYRSFDLWNEFRLGYQFDFTLWNTPFYVNLQWPFGFGLYKQNKPQSFKDNEKENRFFYFPPMFFLGIKF